MTPDQPEVPVEQVYRVVALNADGGPPWHWFVVGPDGEEVAFCQEQDAQNGEQNAGMIAAALNDRAQMLRDDLSTLRHRDQSAERERVLREALEKVRAEIGPAKAYAESYGLEGGVFCSAVHIKLDLIDGYARAALTPEPHHDR